MKLGCARTLYDIMPPMLAPAQSLPAVVEARDPSLTWDVPISVTDRSLMPESMDLARKPIIDVMVAEKQESWWPWIAGGLLLALIVRR